MECPRPYAAPLTPADLPGEVRAALGDDPRLEEPPRQGRTSRVAFAPDAGGDPVVIKRSAGPHLELIRREHRALLAVRPLGVPAPEPLLFLERPAPSTQRSQMFPSSTCSFASTVWSLGHHQTVPSLR